MAKFVRKPLEVDARQVDLNNPLELLKISRWVRGLGGVASVAESRGSHIEIETGEGRLIQVKHGDWVIRGTMGEYWSITDKEFQQYYLIVNEDGTANYPSPCE